MPRAFNIGGPCQADIHYMLPPERRIPGVRELIDGRNYFVLHAPRQVGKSTAMLSLGDTLTAEGRYASVMLSVETAVPFETMDRAAPAMLGSWRTRTQNRLPVELQPPPWPDSDPSTAIQTALAAWARSCPRPLAIFLDEVDSLAPEVLGSLLRQLRDQYNDRPRGFPWSIALVGMRDVKDYVVAAGGTGRAGAGSPFNILAGSLTMRDFTREEIGELYGQHTAETGQVVEPAAVDRAWELTLGQPWLVNALAREATTVLVRDRSLPIRVEDIDEAKETLVRTRPHHLQSLGSRIRDPRVRPVIEAVMIGDDLPDVPDEDLEYVKELGLVRYDDMGQLRLANPIYCDAMPRALAETIRMGMPAPGLGWLDDTGRLDPTRLLTGFLQFWREYGYRMLKAAPYREIAAQLVLLTYLHRVANPEGGELAQASSVPSKRVGQRERRSPDPEPLPGQGGSIPPESAESGGATQEKQPSRARQGPGWLANGGGSVMPEFSVLSGRIDLCLRKGPVTLGIELKVWRDGGADPLTQGLAQLDGYLRGLSGTGARVPGWLVIFDQRSGQVPIEDRTTAQSIVSPAGFDVVVVRA